MAILKKPQTVKAEKAKVGDLVISKAIGVRPEFVGRIVFISDNGRWCHVRDAAGDDWHRSWSDLSVASAATETLKEGKAA